MFSKLFRRKPVPTLAVLAGEELSDAERARFIEYHNSNALGRN